MKRILYKLILGKPEYNLPLRSTAYSTLRVNLVRIWNNTNHHDIGMEKMLRLVLVAVQILFPGLHVRNYFGKKGVVVRNVATEFYVLCKTLLPLLFLWSGLYRSNVVVGISFYLLAETLCYVAALIFVSDMFLAPRSYRRNILMLFLNYLEISLSYAVIYGGLHLLGDKALRATDYIYFSIITSTTIGYGDLHPVTAAGKMIVCAQGLMVVTFVVLFINFFGSKVETRHHEDGM